VVKVSADIAMRFAQIFDELPPLLQTVTKVIAIATQIGAFFPSTSILWAVVNDLVAEGIVEHTFLDVLREMKEMALIIEVSDKDVGQDDTVCFFNPALGDVAWDVCTPSQVLRIAKALIGNYSGLSNPNFKVQLTIAHLHSLIGAEGTIILSYWKRGYVGLITDPTLDEVKKNFWKEIIDSEMKAAGYDPLTALGPNFSYTSIERQALNPRIPLVKLYQGPVSFGPMGLSLSVICRNLFQEVRCFHGALPEESRKLREDTFSAASRYKLQVTIVEDFLKDFDLGLSCSELEAEHALVDAISTPALQEEDIASKALRMLEEYVPNFVELRLQRLYQVLPRLSNDVIDRIFQNAPTEIWHAFSVFRSDSANSKSRGSFIRSKWCSRTDAAQHALMVLAVSNWRPQPIPEYLPVLYTLSVARIRNKVMQRLTEAERILYRHQCSIDDLECFLVVTALLEKHPRIERKLEHLCC
jgi:hypothetical protein